MTNLLHLTYSRVATRCCDCNLTWWCDLFLSLESMLFMILYCIISNALFSELVLLKCLRTSFSISDQSQTPANLPTASSTATIMSTTTSPSPVHIPHMSQVHQYHHDMHYLQQEGCLVPSRISATNRVGTEMTPGYQPVSDNQGSDGAQG